MRGFEKLAAAEICQRHKVIIKYMETNRVHIHYMIETELAMSISKIVNFMKSYTTYHIWGKRPDHPGSILGKNALSGRMDTLRAV